MRNGSTTAGSYIVVQATAASPHYTAVRESNSGSGELTRLSFGPLAFGASPLGVNPGDCIMANKIGRRARRKGISREHHRHQVHAASLRHIPAPVFDRQEQAAPLPGLRVRDVVLSEDQPTVSLLASACTWRVHDAGGRLLQTTKAVHPFKGTKKEKKEMPVLPESVCKSAQISAEQALEPDLSDPRPQLLKVWQSEEHRRRGEGHEHILAVALPRQPGRRLDEQVRAATKHLQSVHRAGKGDDWRVDGLTGGTITYHGMAGTSGDMLSTAQPDGDGKIAWHIFPGDQTSTLIPYVRVLDLTDLELVGAQTARKRRRLNEWWTKCAAPLLGSVAEQLDDLVPHAMARWRRSLGAGSRCTDGWPLACRMTSRSL